jgi:predicted phage terminase large subunit-like protein
MSGKKKVVKDTPKTVKELFKELIGIDLNNLNQDKRNEVTSFILQYADNFRNDKNLKYKIVDFFREVQGYPVPQETAERIKEYLVSVLIEEARKDFYVFAKLMASVVLPNDFIDGRHIKKICERLQEVAESIESPEPTKRAMFFMPPGSMKTVLCSIMFPAWLYGLHPNWHVICVGYNDEFAADKIGHPLKELIGSAEYREIFPNTRIRSDSKSKGRFVTTAKGEFKALGAKARAAGRRAHLLICDDTVSEKDAWSKALRTEINDNYIGGLRSRLMRTPRGAEIITNTRYHLEDISGFLLKVDEDSKRPWEVLSIPAVLDETASELLREPNDPPEMYAPGTSFWPEMQPMEVLLEEKETLMKTEPHKWNALYMQNPTPEEGNIVRFEDWQFWPKENKPPQVTHVLVTMDTAFSEKQRADFSSYLVWGVFYPHAGAPPNLILLYGEKGKWAWPELVERCSMIKREWKPDFMVIEKKASGQSLLQDLFRKGYPVVEFDPRGSKEERLHSAAMWFKQGRIWVPEDKDWVYDIIDEICNFPSAAHDEYADCASMAVIWYRDMGIVEHEQDLDAEELEDVKTALNKTVTTYWDALVKLN